MSGARDEALDEQDAYPSTIETFELINYHPFTSNQYAQCDQLFIIYTSLGSEVFQLMSELWQLLNPFSLLV